MANSHSSQHGFSLIELLTSIGIVAVLAVTAIPSFDNMLKNTRRRQSVDNFWHAVFLARNEAIKRNSEVVLCKSSSGGTQCNNNPGNWADGWIVFDNLDQDNPAQVDNGEPVLRIYNATDQINVTYKGKRQTFAFRPFAQGQVGGTIVFCDARGSDEARAIIISHTGRPRTSTKDASNKPLDCSIT